MTSRRERGNLRALTLTVLALSVTLAILAAQRRWLREPGAGTGSTATVPCWVMLGPIDAITGDGSVLRLRLALDACDAAGQELIKARRSDLEAIVRVVVAAHSRPEVEGPAGIRRLRDVLRLRLGEHVGTMRDVAVDQFVLGRT